MGDYTVFGSKERAGWADAGIVDAYVRHFVPITDFVGRKMVEAGIAPGEKVLDLCCGQGTLTAELAATGADVTGLDFSPNMLELAREAAPGARLLPAPEVFETGAERPTRQVKPGNEPSDRRGRVQRLSAGHRPLQSPQFESRMTSLVTQSTREMGPCTIYPLHAGLHWARRDQCATI